MNATTSKDNSRSINILPNTTKVRLTLKKRFLKCEGRFNKPFNAQHCLVGIIEQLEENVDIARAFSTLMTDFFKTFGHLYH